MNITVSSIELPLVKELKKIGDEHGGQIVVGTHPGRFHPDDLLSVAILMEALPKYSFSVIRSRDSKQLAKADILVDVGGGRFDHHEKVMRYNNNVPMASCGKVLAAVEPNQQLINTLLRNSLYKLQAIDNGERYTIPRGCGDNMFSWVSSFNPTYEERALTDGEYNERFCDALRIVRKIYRRMRKVALAQIHSVDILRKAPLHIRCRFLELPKGGVPWKGYAAENTSLLGVIYESIDGVWVVRLSPDNYDRQDCRVLFPSEWRGLTDEAFELASKIPGAKFCHLGLQLASFATKEAALHAARIVSSKYDLESQM